MTSAHNAKHVVLPRARNRLKNCHWGRFACYLQTLLCPSLMIKRQTPQSTLASPRSCVLNQPWISEDEKENVASVFICIKS